MKLKHIFILFFLITFFILYPEELFQARIYQQDSDPPELLFLHYNEQYSKGDSTFLKHYYLLPDSTVSVDDEVVLLNDEFYRARSQFFQVQETGEVIRKGYRILMRFSDKGEVKEKEFDYKKGLLFGPMFNDFVKMHWFQLLKGEEIGFFLPAPDILRIARFEFERVINSSYEKPGKAVFRMSVASWFLKLFLKSTYFVYDLETKLLESIHGVSILRTEQDGKWEKTTNVDIYYQYKE